MTIQTQVEYQYLGTERVVGQTCVKQTKAYLVSASHASYAISRDP